MLRIHLIIFLKTHQQICCPIPSTEIPILTSHMGNSLVWHMIKESFMSKKYTLHGLCHVSCHIHVATQEYVDASNIIFTHIYIEPMV